MIAQAHASGPGRAFADAVHHRTKGREPVSEDGRAHQGAVERRELLPCGQAQQHFRDGDENHVQQKAEHAAQCENRGVADLKRFATAPRAYWR